MFFNETSHSHQSALLSSTHTARQGKGDGGRECEIEYAGAKSDDLYRVCASLCDDGMKKHIAGVNHAAISQEAHKELQLGRVLLSVFFS